MRFPRPLLAFPLWLSLSLGAQAQGLAQLRLDGALGGKGTQVEIEVGALVDGQAREVDLNLFLGPGTTGAELVSLVVMRLEGAGFRVKASEPDRERDGKSLFIDDALFLRLRVGGGLRAVVTTCEGPPAAVRVVRPATASKKGEVHLSAGTLSPHTGESGEVEMKVQLDAADGMPQVAERLLRVAQERKWMSDRPSGDSWRPIRMVNGSRFTGMSVEVVSAAVWRLEVELASK